VLLGGIFRFEDRLATPVSLLAWDLQNVTPPGVVVHASVAQSVERRPDRAGASLDGATAVPSPFDDLVDIGSLRVRGDGVDRRECSHAQLPRLICSAMESTCRLRQCC
jgi:hypothetical protein